LQKRLYNGWFKRGLISRSIRANYPEGKKIAEGLAREIGYVSGNFDEMYKIRGKVSDELVKVDTLMQEAANASASKGGVKLLKAIPNYFNPNKYASFGSTLYMGPLVKQYSEKVGQLSQMAREKTAAIDSECIADYNSFEKAISGGKAEVDDMELANLQDIFTELGNHKYADKLTILRKKNGGDSQEFFSMMNYLIELDEVPGSCLSLNDVMLGRDGHRDWIDRFSAFSKKLSGVRRDKGQEPWLNHVRYAVREDTIRGYLRQRIAGSDYAKSVVNSTIAAIDKKLST
jgi:hypothetical protein